MLLFHLELVNIHFANVLIQAAFTGKEYFKSKEDAHDNYEGKKNLDEQQRKMIVQYDDKIEKSTTIILMLYEDDNNIGR